MLDSGRQHQQVSHTKRISLPDRLEDDLTFENVDAQRPIGVVGREITIWREGHDRETKRSFLDQRSCAAAVTRYEALIDRLLVSRKVADENFP